MKFIIIINLLALFIITCLNSPTLVRAMCIRGDSLGECHDMPKPPEMLTCPEILKELAREMGNNGCFGKNETSWQKLVPQFNENDCRKVALAVYKFILNYPESKNLT